MRLTFQNNHKYKLQISLNCNNVIKLNFKGKEKEIIKKFLKIW